MITLAELLTPRPLEPYELPAAERLKYIHAAFARDQDLSYLSPRGKLVLEMRAGLGNQKPSTYPQIGKRLGVSPTRARQLEHRAIYRISQNSA